MTRPRLTVAEVIGSCLDEFLERYGPGLTPEQRRALDDLISCRTAALGGHVLGCPIRLNLTIPVQKFWIQQQLE